MEERRDFCTQFLCSILFILNWINWKCVPAINTICCYNTYSEKQPNYYYYYYYFVRVYLTDCSLQSWGLKLQEGQPSKRTEMPATVPNACVSETQVSSCPNIHIAFRQKCLFACIFNFILSCKVKIRSRFNFFCCLTLRTNPFSAGEQPS